jgi:hypothetical protein
MSFLTRDITLQSKVARGAIGIIVGAGVTVMIMGLWPALAAWLGAPRLSSWIDLWVVLLTYCFIPVYVAIWVYWRMAPERSVSGSWARNAMILASVSGATIEVLVYWFLESVAAREYGSPWVRVILACSSAWVSGSLSAILVFERLRPTRKGGPFWQLRRERRAKRGRCLECGFNLTGNVSGVCPECGTEIVED